jgi:membrane-associated phospholipid phosphatase
MLNRIAFATSLIFSPFLLPIGTILILAREFANPGQQAFLCNAIIILFITVIPVLFIFILFRLGKLSDLRMTVQEQRLKPLCFSMASGLVGTYLLHLVDAPKEIVWTGIAYVVNGIVFTAITPFWKISFHSGVAAGCVTVLVFLVGPMFGWLFLLIPLIGWARVYRGRHTPLQTAIAVVVSIASVVLVRQFFPIL